MVDGDGFFSIQRYQLKPDNTIYSIDLVGLIFAGPSRTLGLWGILALGSVEFNLHLLAGIHGYSTLHAIGDA